MAKCCNMAARKPPSHPDPPVKKERVIKGQKLWIDLDEETGRLLAALAQREFRKVRNMAAVLLREAIAVRVRELGGV